MSTDPAVTVAIPTFRPQYLSDTIQSVLAQTFQDYEIVVVNDGSPHTPVIEAVVQSYPGIRYHYQQNAGVSAARNRAVNAARASLIVNLDDDDLLLPSCLESQVSFMQKHPEIDARYVNSVYFGNTKWAGTSWMDHYPTQGEVSFLTVMDGSAVPSNPGAIIRRETLLRLGLYDPVFNSWEDFDLWLRILRSGGRMAFTRTVLARYRRHGANVTLPGLYFLQQGLRVLDKVDSTMELSPEERVALERRRRTLQLDLEMLRGKEALRGHNWAAATQHFETAQQYGGTAKLRFVLPALRSWPSIVGRAMVLRDQYWRFTGHQGI